MMFSFLIPLAALIVGVVGLVRLRRGAVFVPIGHKALGEIISMLEIRAGECAVDLGSGDGRIVIALARAGAEAHGYEHSPLLVWWSRRKIKKAGLSDRAFIHHANFWHEDFSRYKIITIFGISYAMERLERKLLQEAKLGTRVVSYLFPLPTWKPQFQKNGLYFYTVGQKPL